MLRRDRRADGPAAVIVTHDERATGHADRTVHIIDGILEGLSAAAEPVGDGEPGRYSALITPGR